MLRNNGTDFSRLRPLSGNTLANGLLRNAARTKLKENFSGFGQQVSMPEGYQSAFRATIPTLQESGSAVVRFRGAGAFSANASKALNSTVAFLGEGTFSVNGSTALNASVAFPGEGSLTFVPRQVERAAVVFDAGARPSAFDIAQEVWSANAASNNGVGTMGEKLNDAGSASNPWTEVIESGFTAAQILRLIAAAVQGDATGLETGTPTFKGLDGTTDRVTATYAAGTRVVTARDGG